MVSQKSSETSHHLGGWHKRLHRKSQVGPGTFGLKMLETWSPWPKIVSTAAGQVGERTALAQLGPTRRIQNQDTLKTLFPATAQTIEATSRNLSDAPFLLLLPVLDLGDLQSLRLILTHPKALRTVADLDLLRMALMAIGPTRQSLILSRLSLSLLAKARKATAPQSLSRNSVNSDTRST